MKIETEILCKEDIIRKLTDFVLLNSCSINSSGLYNGKAGMALALFEISRCLQDEYIEDQASELLQESLLSKNEDIGFENGLSGIGFALLYLINNKFIDADFEELFGDNLYRILNVLRDWKDKHSSVLLFNNVKIVYFLDAVLQNGTNIPIVPYIDLFSTTVERFLIKQFEDSSDVNLSTQNCKIDVLESFEEYLKIVCNCKLFKSSLNILADYSLLYLKNKYASNFFIGHYLYTIARETGTKCEDLKMVAGKNIRYAIIDIHPEAMPLIQRLNLLYLLTSFYQDRYPECIKLLEKGLLDIREKSSQEKDLLLSIQPANSIAGYQTGIARLLLYWVYRKSQEKQMDCTRFNKIL